MNLYEEVKYEFEIDEEATELDFSVHHQDIDEWVLRDISKLEQNGYLLQRVNKELRIEERDKSYALHIGSKVVYVSKKNYNIKAILHIFQKGTFTDILVKSGTPFFRGFVFVFKRLH